MKTKKSTSKRRNAKHKPLHRRVALHPVSVLLLLCVGVLLVGLTLHSSADSYTVNAQILAPVPTEAAVITSPADQTHFTTRPITVSGTCPEKSYVVLSRNGVFSGTAICAAGQTTFQIQTDLSLGSNVLSAQVFNITGQAGPSSPSITVWYANPPQPPAPIVAPGSSSNSAPAAGSGSGIPSQLINPALPPFFITADYHYQPHFIGQSFSLGLALHGGMAPFAMTVSWGDGTNSTLVRRDNSAFSAKHTYSHAGANEQTILVKLQAVDSQDSTAYLEVAELVCHQTCQVAAPGVIDTANPLVTGAQQWTWLIWPAYLVVSLMVLSFWLGERQEYDNLFRHKSARRPRRT